MTKWVVSRVRPPWKNMSLSVPLPLCVVGGPSAES